MRTVAALVLGVVCAIAIACGGAQKQPAMAPPPGATTSGGAMPAADRKGEIEQLESEIRADLARMGLPEQSPEMAPACADCTPQRMSSEIKLHAEDTTCQPGTSDTCRDSCRLADAICTSAKKICTLAADMGNDTWANGKCVDGKSSCDRANKRCCGCQL